MNKTGREHGFIKAIILIVIILAILAYWGFDIKKVLTSPEFKEKGAFIWNWIKDLWTNYIWYWLMWVWDHALRPLLEKINLIEPAVDPSTILAPQT